MRPTRLEAVALAMLAMLACGCGRGSHRAASAPGPATAAPADTALGPCPLVDRARELGVNFTYRNGGEADHSTILESLGGGVGWLDYDLDGEIDLAATGGGGFAGTDQITGRPLGLFRNEDGRRFIPVAAPANIESPGLYTNGLTVGDYDNDGFPDLLATGYGLPQLWHNLGDGTFAEVAAPAGIVDSRWGSSAGWADLDRDGNLDLYIAHYVNWSFANHPYCASDKPGIREICPPREYEPLPHVVYFSRGDGTFADGSSRAGLRADGKGLGVLLCDVEPDGDVDIYVANDTTDNFLYLNDGAGRFTEEGILRGVALDDHGIPNGSMGVEMCDFNRDGLPDLWVANYEHESFALYRNEGGGNFLHVSQRLGITDLGGLFVGFGTACEDFDADGDQDFVVANGHVIKYPGLAPRKQAPLLVKYNGQRFERARFTAESFFEQPQEGRGLAVGDYDGDGDLDIAISRLNDSVALLENNFRDENRWISLRLVGTRSSRDAVGSRAALQLGNQTWERQVTGGGSYLSHSARDLHFVLPPGADQGKLVIHWPSGSVQSVDARNLSGRLTIIEPLEADAAAVPIYSRKVTR